MNNFYKTKNLLKKSNYLKLQYFTATVVLFILQAVNIHYTGLFGLRKFMQARIFHVISMIQSYKRQNVSIYMILLQRNADKI